MALEDRAAAHRLMQELAEIERDRVRYAARFKVLVRPDKPQTRTSQVTKRRTVASAVTKSSQPRAQPAASSWVIDERGMRGVMWQQSYLGRKSASFYHGAARNHWEYEVRDEAVLLGADGQPIIISNMGEDWVEIGAAWQVMEDASVRKNAKIQIRAIAPFDADMSEGEMIFALRHFCETVLEPCGLPFSAVIHKPPEGGDNRNFHPHIAFSRRPMRRVEAYSWEVADEVRGELDGKDGVQMLRHLWAHSMSQAAEQARSNRRYTGLGYGARGLDLEAGEHLGDARAAMVKRGDLVWAHERNRIKRERNRQRLIMRDLDKKIAALTTLRDSLVVQEGIGAVPAIPRQRLTPAAAQAQSDAPLRAAARSPTLRSRMIAAPETDGGVGPLPCARGGGTFRGLPLSAVQHAVAAPALLVEAGVSGAEGAREPLAPSARTTVRAAQPLASVPPHTASPAVPLAPAKGENSSEATPLVAAVSGEAGRLGRASPASNRNPPAADIAPLVAAGAEKTDMRVSLVNLRAPSRTPDPAAGLLSALQRAREEREAERKRKARAAAAKVRVAPYKSDLPPFEADGITPATVLRDLLLVIALEPERYGRTSDGTIEARHGDKHVAAVLHEWRDEPAALVLARAVLERGGRTGRARWPEAIAALMEQHAVHRDEGAAVNPGTAAMAPSTAASARRQAPSQHVARWRRQDRFAGEPPTMLAEVPDRIWLERNPFTTGAGQGMRVDHASGGAPLTGFASSDQVATGRQQVPPSNVADPGNTAGRVAGKAPDPILKQLQRLDPYVWDDGTGRLSISTPPADTLNVPDHLLEDERGQAALRELRREQQQVFAVLVSEANRRPLSFRKTGARPWPRDFDPSTLARLDSWSADDGFGTDLFFAVELPVAEAHTREARDRAMRANTSTVTSAPAKSAAVSGSEQSGLSDRAAQTHPAGAADVQPIVRLKTRDPRNPNRLSAALLDHLADVALHPEWLQIVGNRIHCVGGSELFTERRRGWSSNQEVLRLVLKVHRRVTGVFNDLPPDIWSQINQRIAARTRPGTGTGPGGITEGIGGTEL